MVCRDLAPLKWCSHPNINNIDVFVPQAFIPRPCSFHLLCGLTRGADKNKVKKTLFDELHDRCPPFYGSAFTYLSTSAAKTAAGAKSLFTKLANQLEVDAKLGLDLVVVTVVMHSTGTNLVFFGSAAVDLFQVIDGLAAIIKDYRSKCQQWNKPTTTPLLLVLLTCNMLPVTVDHIVDNLLIDSHT
jgi:hypothetical protein